MTFHVREEGPVTVAIQRGDYFYTIVDDKPGVLHNLLNHFRERQIAMLAFTVFPVEQGRSQVDFFPVDAELFGQAAREAGLDIVGPRSAFVIQGQDSAGALVRYHEQLAAAGINIHAANGVFDSEGGFGYVLWVKPEDYEQAARTIGLDE